MRDFDGNLANKIVGLAALTDTRAARDDYYALIQHFESPGCFLAERGQDTLWPGLAAAISDRRKVDELAGTVHRLAQRGVGIAALGGASYPAALAAIYRPPKVIFYRGPLEKFEAKERAMALVGSRKGDSFGCSIAREWGAFAAARGACLVSGLALGIDAAAHRGALESSAELCTIAVLGNGLDEIYPRMNEPLARDILDRGGVILSQFEMHEKPYPSNFLDRNRVIAGLAQSTLVIQAPRRSGSLATARYALEENRDVLVVPGNIDDPRYEGSNRLIKQGAHVILEREDLAEFLPPAREPIEPGQAGAPAGLSGLAQAIVAHVRENTRVHYDELSALSGPAGVAGEILSLELAGLITRLPGNYITLK